MRGRWEVRRQLDALERARTPVYSTAVSWAEVFAGIRSSEEYRTEAFLARRGLIALDQEIGRRAGRYLARYAASHGLEMADALIAAAASVSGLSLWTLNRRHYPMTDLRFFPD